MTDTGSDDKIFQGVTELIEVIAEQDTEIKRLRAVLRQIAEADAPEEEKELGTVAAWLREAARRALETTK